MERARLQAFLLGFWSQVRKRWQDGADPFDEEDARAAGLRAAHGTTLAGPAGGNLVPIPGGSLRLEIPRHAAFCGNVGRQHRSRWVKLIVDVSQGRFFQMCYDDACAFYASRSFHIPDLTGGEAASSASKDRSSG